MPATARNRFSISWLSLGALAVVAFGVGCGSNSVFESCTYGGVKHRLGDTFASTDGCNTCSCTKDGVACTLRACVPDAGAGDAAPPASDAPVDTNAGPDASGPDGQTPDGSAVVDAIGATDMKAGDANAPDGNVAACTYDGRGHAIGDSFPSTDGCNTCSCTKDGVACTLRACVDSGTPIACAFDRTYSFWYDGGFRAYADRHTLAPARTHTVARDRFTNAPPVMCSRDVVCSDPAAVDVAQIQAALGHADVVKNLAAATPAFYGTDTRPVDGAIFVFERDDKRGFSLGSGDVPAGLRALENLLSMLASETVASASCANLR